MRIVAKFFTDDLRRQRRGHRRSIGLERGQGLLGTFGQGLDDEADQLTRLHHHALHLPQFAGHVLRGLDGETLLEQ